MKNKNILAGVTAAALLWGIASPSVLAAAPQPRCDETMYVVTDFYGGLEQASVVKSYQTNGASQLVDRGVYQQVTNMSTLSQPTVEGDRVTFDVEGKDRFYFEGMLDAEQTVLPWTFDLTYKLNGADASPEQLAGAQGLVEIDLHITPNPAAPEYQRNNMMLEAAAMVDTSEVLSVEAPGAQVQTVGGKKAIVFVALPGEEQHFQLRIGSNDFSFAGFVMLMVPVTLEQMSDVQELREVKEKTEDSAEAINDSLDVVLDTLNGLQSGLSATTNGLKGLDSARGIISGGKGQVYEQGDKALATLEDVANKLEPLNGHLGTAQTALDSMEQQLGVLMETTKTLKPQLEEIRKNLTRIRDDLAGLEDMVYQLKDNEDWRDDLMEDLEEDFEDLEDSMEDVKNTASGLESACKTLKLTMDRMPRLVAVELGQEGTTPELLPIIKSINTNVAYINGTLDAVMPQITNTTSNAAMLSGSASDLSKDGASLCEDMQRAIRLLNSYAEILEEHADDAMSLLGDTSKACKQLKETSLIADDLIDQTDELYQILHDNQQNLDAAIADSQALVQSSTQGVRDTKNFLQSVRDLAKKAGSQLDSGTQATLNGLIASLNQTIKGLAQTGTIQNAKDTVKNLVDDEWDKFSGDANNLLNIDPDAPAISFTSAENPTPDSVQILVRTKEITTESVEPEETEDPEQVVDDSTVLGRVWSIFQKIWQIIQEVFS